MRFLKFIGVALVAVMFLGSCSGPSERVVTAKDVSISGFISKYLKVVNGSYIFTNNGENAFITVKFELKEKPISEVCRKKHPEDIRLNAIGEGDVIFDTGTYGFEPSRTEMSKLKELLNNGQVGDKVKISFKWHYFGVSKEEGKPIFKKASSFEIIDNTFNFCNKTSNDDLHWDDGYVDSKNYETNTSKSSEDWNAVLDDYEAYVDKYIKFYKKAMNGDNSAMSEYPVLMEKATSFAEKLEDAKGNLSSKQVRRMSEIQMKMLNGMQ